MERFFILLDLISHSSSFIVTCSPFSEETIIKAAYTYEQATNFREKYKPTFKGGAQ